MLNYYSYIRNYKQIHNNQNITPMTPEEFEAFISKVTDSKFFQSSYKMSDEEFKKRIAQYDADVAECGTTFMGRLDSFTMSDRIDPEFYYGLCKKVLSGKLSHEDTQELYRSFIRESYFSLKEYNQVNGVNTTKLFNLCNKYMNMKRLPVRDHDLLLLITALFHIRHLCDKESVRSERSIFGSEVHYITKVADKYVYYTTNPFEDFEEFDEDMPESVANEVLVYKPIFPDCQLYSLSRSDESKFIAFVDMTCGKVYDIDFNENENFGIYDSEIKAKNAILYA